MPVHPLIARHSTMPLQPPKTHRLQDYQPSEYLIETVDLRFELEPMATRVNARIAFVRNSQAEARGLGPLRLDGENMELLSLKMDGITLGADRYICSSTGLLIIAPPERFTLEVTTRLQPEANTALQGLYLSSGTFCTQCEAEGFRRITYFLDRPDVMARYTTTVVADQKTCPVLLSNGNPVERGELENNRHWIRWQDPYPKPAYLFALVAGDLACIEDQYTTTSGREVALRIYVESHNATRCDHAMASLKKAMRWDEEVFGLEYDLDIYMIVAVDDFNMGAMENKGLNVFNSKYVLADADTATDADFNGVESVIAHEYFHNWTGNRVTCRDWFQLSLKEGLTVYRDQEFSADMGSRPVQRIGDVRVLRNAQFPEDAGPMAHPVRPASYIEINNFYTATVYNKGAEVIHMYEALVGTEAFRAGVRLYLKRHDGQAVTTDDFLQAIADASGADLEQFRRWYSQAGTPVIHAEGHHDAKNNSYELKLTQSCPPTPEQETKAPFHIPVAMGLLDSNGHDLPLQISGETAAATIRVLSLRKESETFRFENIDTPPTPSLLRGFSAPVQLESGASDNELAFLLAHDSDSFNRWEASQELAVRLTLRLVEQIQHGEILRLNSDFAHAMGQTLGNPDLDPAFIAEVFVLPGEGYIAQRMEVMDPASIHQARCFLRLTLARSLREKFEHTYQENTRQEAYRYTQDAVGRRSLKNVVLSYLMELEDSEIRGRCLTQFRDADNMTDALGALASLSQHDCEERAIALAEFETRWQSEPLVMDKWFSLQATSRLPGTLEKVKELMQHAAYNRSNPNRIRALIGAFSHANPAQFHAADGSGYVFLRERILELDPRNPQLAARLLGAFGRWRKLGGKGQQHIRGELGIILKTKGLSRDSYEIASRTLGNS